MRVYTVHAPPRRRRARGGGDADRVMFVREGFRWLAFLFPALWFLFNRAWLPLLGYIVLALGAPFAVERLELSDSILLPLAFGLHLLIGFEADSLRRWSLARKGWRLVGVAAGRDLAEAERSFFNWYGSGAPTWREDARPPPRDTDAIGFFPEPVQ